MIHLSDDKLLSLAKITVDDDIFSPIQIKQLQHLKECSECYGSYCRFVALMETTSEMGYSIVANAIGLKENDLEDVTATDHIVATFKIVTNYLTNKITTQIEQLNQELSSLAFEQPLAFATRGSSKTDTSIGKLENLENDRTFIVYDAKAGKLLVQIDIDDMPVADIKLYLSFNDGTVREIDMKSDGYLLKGSILDVHDTDFEVIIEKN